MHASSYMDMRCIIFLHILHTGDALKTDPHMQWKNYIWVLYIMLKTCIYGIMMIEHLIDVLKPD